MAAEIQIVQYIYHAHIKRRREGNGSPAAIEVEEGRPAVIEEDGRLAADLLRENRFPLVSRPGPLFLRYRETGAVLRARNG